MAEANSFKRFYYINSANRLSGTSSAFSIAAQVPTNEQYDSCVVTQASIPVSYYLVQAGYNTFQLKELTDAVTLTIPAGNYNLNSFTVALQALLNANSPNSWTYGVSYSNSFTTVMTGLITYTVTGNSSQPSFIFGDNYLNEQFGFDYQSTATFNSNTLISANVVSFINENVIYIHSDIVDGGDNDILLDLYGSAIQSLGVVTYGPTPDIEGYSKPFKGKYAQVFNFYLTDDNNTPLNLNGQDYTFTLLVYRKNKFNDRIIDFCKYLVNKLETPAE